ncbi:MAG: phenylacetate-CoA oxygenase subunit PaaJ [Actinobacteria bacterium]|nr:phenylacetate-CoA oxygenase subunit PaaJ [Actinomycetota bacterium]
MWEALSGVHDPEIPPLPITDLGIVERVTVEDDAVHVALLPTFSGCPALDVIAEDVEAAVRAVAGRRPVTVRFVHSPPWTSDRITPAGREALRSYGLTPPGEGGSAPAFVPLAALSGARGTSACPFCGSDDTVLESAFGPTLCRSTHFCRSCRNPFEAFKPKRVG